MFYFFHPGQTAGGMLLTLSTAIVLFTIPPTSPRFRGVQMSFKVLPSQTGVPLASARPQPSF